MSLITRCPTCETMFKVVPDQLRVSEGWVRCGQCAEIFDATQNMVSPPEPQSPSPSPAAEPPGPPAPAPMPAPTRTFIRPAAESPEPDAATAVVQPPPEMPAPLAHRQAADEPGWVESPATDPETVFLERDSEPEPPLHVLAQHEAADPAKLPPPPGPTTTAFARTSAFAPSEPAPRDLAAASFLRDSDKPSFWNRPAMRWALLLVLLALLALLIVQIVLKERDRIAAMAPATRPTLQALCDVAGCSLSPLRQIESIIIDSSSFSRVRGDDYQLGIALRNTAPIAVAMPSIELSLTDPQDKAVIRRVLQPAEFAGGAHSLAKASVWSGSLALSVKPGANTDRIAGYRLLAFYP